ncbi:MAG: hypothetical protein EPO40_16585 [Myxococcaceae bacterium]|nr:MAG: hypothetical protein EPO40_16585 [Myxococcaceae bacterium]
MAHTSASTKRRGPAYAPSVVAHRKPKGDPTAPREVLIRDLTSAEVEAIDGELDAANAGKRKGDQSSRSAMLARWIRATLDAKREARGLPPLDAPKGTP